MLNNYTKPPLVVLIKDCYQHQFTGNGHIKRQNIILQVCYAIRYTHTQRHAGWRTWFELLCRLVPPQQIAPSYLTDTEMRLFVAITLRVFLPQRRSIRTGFHPDRRQTAGPMGRRQSHPASHRSKILSRCHVCVWSEERVLRKWNDVPLRTTNGCFEAQILV